MNLAPPWLLVDIVVEVEPLSPREKDGRVRRKALDLLAIGAIKEGGRFCLAL